MFPSIPSVVIARFLLFVTAIMKMVRTSKKKLMFEESDRQIQEEEREITMCELVPTNANVVFGVSGLLHESTSCRRVGLANAIEGHESKMGEEVEDGEIPNV